MPNYSAETMEQIIAEMERTGETWAEVTEEIERDRADEAEYEAKMEHDIRMHEEMLHDMGVGL